MEKIAVFVEGLTETLFVRAFLCNRFNPDHISIIFISLFKNYNSIPSIHNPHAKITFFIYDAEGDGNVLGSVKDRERGLFKSDFKKIVILQDMYSQNYEKLSLGKISPQITSKFISARNAEILKMSQPTKIRFHYSIMEIEAWILAMPQLFQKLDVRLTTALIKSKLKYDLQSIDPQLFFFKPSIDISKIYLLVGKHYDKSRGCIEKLMRLITKKDLVDILACNKVKNFVEFNKELTSQYNSYLL